MALSREETKEVFDQTFTVELTLLEVIGIMKTARRGRDKLIDEGIEAALTGDVSKSSNLLTVLRAVDSAGPKLAIILQAEAAKLQALEGN